jgi:indolepyruvate ferredoxin oxidoreductase
MKQMFRATRGRSVDDALMRDVVLRAYDCVIWGGFDYAKRYCDRLVETFNRDVPQRDFELTRAVVWNLAKAMLIKDEPYVAAMLTSPDKYKRDQRRWKVNPARGDRITYRHYNRPEFVLFGRKFSFKWRSRDWELRLMARGRFLRDLMPKWHRAEREYRDWFESVVDRIDWRTDAEYDKWVSICRTPEMVSGFRAVRYPKMAAARARAEALLSESAELESDEPEVVVNLSHRIAQSQP